MDVLKPKKIIHKVFSSESYFPGNPYYPLLIYKKVYSSMNEPPETIQEQLRGNDWGYSWVDSIYDFHHYHSNTHEALVIISGECQVLFGGENGSMYTVNQGDVVIIPAGVAHKSLKRSNNFQCIGAYPFDVGYDMNYGASGEYAKAIEMIKQVGLPKKDPIFGERGLLFNYWK